MKNQALISVIIPIYNVENYLRECVDSVINQTYGNFEIILVDDGSTDSSGKICDEYIGKATVIHQKNSGLSGARNTGFEASKGEYVYFLDSDDYILPETLEKLYETAEKDKADFVFFDAVSFADGNFKVSQNYIRKNEYDTCGGLEMLKKLWINKDYHSAAPLLFLKRSFLQENKIKFTDGILYEDMVYTYQAFCCAETVSQCREALYYRRYRESSIMTSKKNKKHFQSAVTVCREVNDYTKKSNITHDETANKYISRCAYNVFNIYEKLGKTEKKELKNELKSFKSYVINNDSFGDNSLKMRCYGKLFWFIYKVFEKVTKR